MPTVSTQSVARRGTRTQYGHSLYTSEGAQSFFDGCLRHMLDYKGKYTGQV